jgi:dihydrofolate reductase
LKKIIIAAISRNNVIGKEGNIPWHSDEELKHFKDTTLGYPIIMGRRTFESIGKPLIKRLNIIITSHPELFIKFVDIKCFFSVKEALNFCEMSNYDKVFIAGGGKLFEDTINYADEMIISQMNFHSEGDTFFPVIDPEIWTEKENILFKEFKVATYRKNN